MKTLIFTTILILSFFVGKAQNTNPALVGRIHEMLKDCSYFEVTEDMFNTLAEDERYQHEEEMAYLKKIKFLIFVECPPDRKMFHDDFISNAELKGFKIMMRSKSAHEQFTFYRKSVNDLKEYLLLHDRGLSYIVTSLNISTINELSGIMNMAGGLGQG